MNSLDEALAQLRNGNIIVVFDGEEREGEADLIFAAKFATPNKIELLRKDGGGLICAAISKEHAETIGLPFLTDLFEKSGGTLAQLACKKTAYGDRPSFTLPINNRKVFTGITDEDRALTIKTLDTTLGNGIEHFAEEFYSPGHVHILIGSGLKNRKGHTELALALGERAGLSGAMVLCEMLGEKKALTRLEAKEYAEKHNFAFLEGKEIIEALL